MNLGIFCWWVTALTRSVQVAVVLSFSSISFPIFCTVTWVCLMALWAVWSLQEENTKSSSRSLCITTHRTTGTTPCWNCVSKRPLNWLAASVLWLHQQFISFFLDVYSNCLEGIVWIMIVPMWKSHCAVCLLSLLVSFSDLLGLTFIVPGPLLSLLNCKRQWRVLTSNKGPIFRTFLIIKVYISLDQTDQIRKNTTNHKYHNKSLIIIIF